MSARPEQQGTPPHRGLPIELGGAVYVVPPLTLGAIEEFEPRMFGFEGAPTGEQVRLVIDLAHRALLRNYPALTREQVAELLDMDSMFDVFLVVMRVSGLLQVAPEGKATTAPPTGGTGAPSTPISPPAAAGASSTAAIA